MTLKIETFSKHPLDNNNYVVYDTDTKEAALIDCSMPDDDVMNWVRDHDLTLKYILLTHGHFDHIMGVSYYRERYGVEAWLHEKDAPLLPAADRYMRHFHTDQWGSVRVKTFDDKKHFNVGKYTIEVIPTPGHTLGGVCYFVEGNLFSGDTLFLGTCGRTDLAESDEAAMQKSLTTLFKRFPDETPVFPGHGAATTIGHERWLYQ